MKITIECNSIEELRNFCFESGYLVSEDRIAKAEAATKASNKVDENKQITIAEPETAPEPAEEVRIEDVRKLLSVVNKKTGANTAKEWIKELGFKTLAEVTDQKTLIGLKEKAEEVINAE